MVGTSPCRVALQSCGLEPQVTVPRDTNSRVDWCWEGWIVWGPAGFRGVQCWEGAGAQGCHQSTGSQPGCMRNVAQEEAHLGPCSPRAAKEAKWGQQIMWRGFLWHRHSCRAGVAPSLSGPAESHASLLPLLYYC